MKLKALLAGAFIALASTAAHAQGPTSVLQIIENAEGQPTTINNIVNGINLPSMGPPENVVTTYDLSDTIVSSFDFKLNLFEPGTNILSDTAEMSGTAGASIVNISFHSDTEGGAPLTPLTGSGVTNLAETGGLQDVGTITPTHGGTFTLQVESELGEAPPIPEPATWAMMLVGLAGLGAVMRNTRRKTGAALAAG